VGELSHKILVSITENNISALYDYFITHGQWLIKFHIDMTLFLFNIFPTEYYIYLCQCFGVTPQVELATRLHSLWYEHRSTEKLLLTAPRVQKSLNDVVVQEVIYYTKSSKQHLPLRNYRNLVSNFNVPDEPYYWYRQAIPMMSYIKTHIILPEFKFDYNKFIYL